MYRQNILFENAIKDKRCQRIYDYHMVNQFLEPDSQGHLFKHCSLEHQAPQTSHSQFQSTPLSNYQYPQNCNQSASFPQCAYNCEPLYINNTEKRDPFVQTNTDEQLKHNEMIVHNWMKDSKGTCEETTQEKRRRHRQTYTREQTQILENEFSQNCSIRKSRRNFLAAQLNLSDRQIKVWFQNRRMKEKKKKGDQIPSTAKYHENFHESSTIIANDNPTVSSLNINNETKSIYIQQPKQINTELVQDKESLSRYDNCIVGNINYPTVEELTMNYIPDL